MGVPKSKTSKMKSRMRRGSKRWSPTKLKKCPECDSSVPSHIVCPSCGYYKGKQVYVVDNY